MKLKGKCWIWPGAKNNTGYGEIVGRREGKAVAVAAHRIVWEAIHGPIPPGMVIRHRCDNPPCIRLRHLQIGTQGDNVRDAVERGRHVSPNTGKTHCKKGHAFTEENTYVHTHQGYTRRRCRTCFGPKLGNLRNRATQVGLAGDVVALKNIPCFVPGNLHGNALRNLRPHEIANRAAPEIMYQ